MVVGHRYFGTTGNMIKQIALGLIILAIVCVVRPVWSAGSEGPAATRPAAIWAYIGTLAGPREQGIYLLKVDAASGRMTAEGRVADLEHAGFLALHPRLPILYAVTEKDDVGKKHRSEAVAYAIAGENGKLTELNRQLSGGTGSCYISIPPHGKVALVAHYGNGSVSALPLDTQGRLQPAASVVQHHGSSIDPQRQEGPHAHCFDADPAGKFALAADLGLDKVLIYQLDSNSGVLTPNDPPFWTIAPGSGPRHVAFEAHGRFVYVSGEMSSTVTACRYDAQKGTLQTLQTISTLPADFHGDNTAAEIHIHPSGKYLYASNRGHDSIACFSIDPESGRLTATGHTSTLGKTPRNFTIDPSGTLMLVANQNSDSVVSFHIDQTTGALHATGSQVTVPHPTCVLMVPVAGQ